MPVNPFPSSSPYSALTEDQLRRLSAQRQTAAGYVPSGEAKNQAPFTNPIVGSSGRSTAMDPTTGLGYPATTTVPAFTPDYGTLIQNDPAYKQTLADLAANKTYDVAGRNAAINSALVRFGLVPDITQAQKTLGFSLSDILNPETASLAQNNPYSTEANIARSFQQALMHLRGALAARGMLHSGELPYQLGLQQQARGQAEYDAMGRILDSILGVQNQFVVGQRTAAQQQQAAAEAATNRAVQLNPPTGAATATYIGLDPNNVAVYRGPDGTLHGVDGSPYTGPGVPTAPGASPAAPSPDAHATSAFSTPIGSTLGVPAGSAAAVQGGRLGRINYGI